MKSFSSPAAVKVPFAGPETPPEVSSEVQIEIGPSPLVPVARLAINGIEAAPGPLLIAFTTRAADVNIEFTVMTKVFCPAL